MPMTTTNQTDQPQPKTIAIACESGGFRCVFVHGVLDALEEAGVRAVAYAAASASVLPAALAAIGSARETGVGYWHAALEVRMREGNGMSEMVLAGLARYAPQIEDLLFANDAPRFVIAVSEVVDRLVAEGTQGALASRMGREQLLAMARGDASWADASLRAVMFDTSGDEDRRLDRANFREAAYASSRMLHAWRVPATIAGRPYIDASYTVGFPARVLADGSAATIVAIATGTAPAFTNLYRSEPLGDHVGTVPIELIAPPGDLKELGVDFTTASIDGLDRGYALGRECAIEWLRSGSVG
jgi:predicted acylesterase/phospholipase RssA